MSVSTKRLKERLQKIHDQQVQGGYESDESYEEGGDFSKNLKKLAKSTNKALKSTQAISKGAEIASIFGVPGAAAVSKAARVVGYGDDGSEDGSESDRSSEYGGARTKAHKIRTPRKKSTKKKSSRDSDASSVSSRGSTRSRKSTSSRKSTRSRKSTGSRKSTRSRKSTGSRRSTSSRRSSRSRKVRAPKVRDRSKDVNHTKQFLEKSYANTHGLPEPKYKPKALTEYNIYVQTHIDKARSDVESKNPKLTPQEASREAMKLVAKRWKARK
jgi:hypothetical protein